MRIEKRKTKNLIRMQELRILKQIIQRELQECQKKKQKNNQKKKIQKENLKNLGKNNTILKDLE